MTAVNQSFMTEVTSELALCVLRTAPCSSIVEDSPNMQMMKNENNHGLMNK